MTMCFVIRNNTPLRNRKAYKIVSFDGRPQVKSHLTSARYIAGRVTVAEKLHGSIFRRGIGRRSEAGIYVYLLTVKQRRTVLSWLGGSGTLRLIEVRVNPADFIANGRGEIHGQDVTVATYRKVKTVGNANA